MHAQRKRQQDKGTPTILLCHLAIRVDLVHGRHSAQRIEVQHKVHHVDKRLEVFHDAPQRRHEGGLQSFRCISLDFSKQRLAHQSTTVFAQLHRVNARRGATKESKTRLTKIGCSVSQNV